MGLSLPWLLGLAAMLAYTAAAWPVHVRTRWPDVALAVGWLAHGAALALDISGYGAATAGARFGFAPALSATVWIVIAVHAIESRLLPLPAFLLGSQAPSGPAEWLAGLRLTGHFLGKDAFGHQHKPLPTARDLLFHRIASLAAAPDTPGDPAPAEKGPDA